MKRIFHFLIMTTVMLYSQKVFTQTLHVVEVTNFSFTPSQLTISVGDTVRWTNILGTHNVVADDNSFTSGPLAPAPWEYTHVFTDTGSNPYYCALHGGPGGVGMSGVITVQTATNVQDEGTSIHKFDLKQNYPNPFNPSTSISYQLAISSQVTLKVYDILGNEIASLVNEEKQSGVYKVEFDASYLPSGIYFYTMRTSGFVETKKMTLMR